MAVAATTVYEIRTTGDDANGGGFNSARGGTDYTLQDAAQKSGADLTMHGTNNTKVSPVAAKVAAADVGNLIHISAGTNWTTGWYEITAQDGGDPGYWTLDRSPAAAGEANLGTYKMGGALATPGGLGAVLKATTGGGGGVSGLAAYMKGGTYSLTGTTVNVSGGPLDLHVTEQGGKAFYLKGYSADSTRGSFTGTKPVIDCNGNAPTSVIETNGTYGEQHTVAFIEIDGDSQACNGINGNNYFYNRATFCYVHDTDGSYAFGNLMCANCRASSCAAVGFYSIDAFFCLADNCEIGFQYTYIGVSCISDTATVGDGFMQCGVMIHCVSYDSAGDGFESNTDALNCGLWINCISVSDGAYSYKTTTPHTLLLNCASDSAPPSGRTSTPYADLNRVDLSGDPFTDAANGDFSLIATGAGAQCRAGGFDPYGQTGAIDIGAVQHADPTLPAIEDVEAGVQYGAGGTEYTGTLAKASIDWDTSWAFVDYSTGTDWNAVDIANGADLTSDAISLDEKIACEVSVTVVEDNTGACTGNVSVFICRDVDGTNYEDYTEDTDNDAPGLACTIVPVQNKTRRKTFTIFADELSSFKIAIDNASGQTLTTTVKIRYAVMMAP
jgi:hypothetical protein